MKKVYITITGLNHRFGQEFLEPKMKVQLVKEPDNEYDNEAIKVMMEGLGHIGYVANSTYTVLGDCMSAGRLYDRIGATAIAKVKYVLPKGVVCVVSEKSLIYCPPEDDQVTDKDSVPPADMLLSDDAAEPDEDLD